MVFRNGDRETCAFIAVCNFEEMLSTATAKLHLLSAARKVFLKGGHVVKSWEEIIKFSNCSDENGEYLELYISAGEPYRNPFKFINGLLFGFLVYSIKNTVLKSLNTYVMISIVVR